MGEDYTKYIATGIVAHPRNPKIYQEKIKTIFVEFLCKLGTTIGLGLRG